MTGTHKVRPRIFWYELASRWAIRAPQLADEHKARRFAMALRQTCDGVFHHGAQGWVVPEHALPAAINIVKQYYRDVELIERERVSYEAPPPQPTDDQAYETFCALVGWRNQARLSFARARALYRRAAVRMHPDVGGSSDGMASLNAAWSAIRDALT